MSNSRAKIIIRVVIVLLLQLQTTQTLCLRNTLTISVKSKGRLQTKLLLNSDKDQRNVGDYVKNVHGGKYQFGMDNVIGQEFAESLYSSSTYNDEFDSEELIDPNEELPKWTQRMVQNAVAAISDKSTAGATTANVIRLDETFEICNEERSWEIFYAFILPECKRGTYNVTPAKGHLAPRGGASNICNENKPYLDTAVLKAAQYNGDGVVNDNDGDPFCDDTGYCCYVIVGTEEETWFYKVIR